MVKPMVIGLFSLLGQSSSAWGGVVWGMSRSPVVYAFRKFSSFAVVP